MATSNAPSPGPTPTSGDSAANGSNSYQSGSQGSAGEQFSGIVDSAKQAGAHVLDQAKDQAASRADQHRQTLASNVQAVAQAFHGLGDSLRDQGQGPVADYASQMGHAIASQVEQFGNYLRDRDIHQLLSDTEEFARRSPAVFFGSAFVIGLAASRFLKSSRPSSNSGPAQDSNFGTEAQGVTLALPPASSAAGSTSNPNPGFPPDAAAQSSSGGAQTPYIDAEAARV